MAQAHGLHVGGRAASRASRSTGPIVRRLRAAGISGATTLRGIWGFHGDHAPHGDRLFQLGRHVPAVTVVIDAPERIAAAFAIIDELTAERGLVTSELVPAMRRPCSGREPLAGPRSILNRKVNRFLSS